MPVSRRQFLATAAAAATLPAVLGPRYAFGQANIFAPPASPRQKFNLNLDWRFQREDVSGAEAPAFNDAKWSQISLPHSFNDVDSFRTIISHGGGDRGTWKGISWYRKHFKLPADMAGRKVFLEFEGMRQAGDIFLNGKPVGLYENGVTAYGVDISAAVHFGTQENVLAVKVDNTAAYKERATQTTFEWNSNDFNPNHGGINRHVWLHVAGQIYQTLPLFYGLESQGIYIHAANFNIAAKTADLTVESEVRNASGDRATVALSAVVVTPEGRVLTQFDADPVDMVDGEKSVIIATGSLKGARFWSVEDPYLYDVYTILKVDGKVVDVDHTTTGFRKTEFKGGAGKGGVYLNDKFVYLKGFAQRSADEWAGLGAGYPDWLHDYHRAAHPRLPRQLHALDARRAARRSTPTPSPASASSRSAPPATRSATPTAASGTSASRSCATPSSTSATTPASSSGRPATPSSRPSTCSRWSRSGSSGTPKAAASSARAATETSPANTAVTPSPSTTAS